MVTQILLQVQEVKVTQIPLPGPGGQGHTNTHSKSRRSRSQIIPLAGQGHMAHERGHGHT